jgi:hypothetical protein
LARSFEVHPGPRIGGSGKIGYRCPLAVCPWGTIVVGVSVGEVSGRTVV